MAKRRMGMERGPLPILGAYPVIIVGANTDGKADFATVAWTGVACSTPPTISIALQHHRHSLKGIRQNMNFSVNVPSLAQVKETDYCGLVSGARVDKVKDCRFTVFYGKLESVPFIQQCPVNHACEVVQILNLGSHELIIGRIVETYVSEDCLTDGRADPAKIKPILFAGRKYHGLGEDAGEPFKTGIAINPGEKMDTLQELEKMRKMNDNRNPEGKQS